jgi:hypothetical protein
LEGLVTGNEKSKTTKDEIELITLLIENGIRKTILLRM